MAAAADAERHLSPAVIERATRHVQDLDSDFHTCTDATSSVDGEISADLFLANQFHCPLDTSLLHPIMFLFQFF